MKSSSSSHESHTDLLYALIALKASVLCHYQTPSITSTNNLRDICTSILQRIPAIDSRMSYHHDSLLFHYVVEAEVVYLVVASERVGKRIPFCFLDDIRVRFKQWKQQQSPSSPCDGVSPRYSEFTEQILMPRFHFFNSEPTLEAIQASRSELSLTLSASPGLGPSSSSSSSAMLNYAGSSSAFPMIPDRCLITPLDVRVVGRENFAMISENFSVYSDGSVKSGRVPFDPYDRVCGFLWCVLVVLVLLFLIIYNIYYRQDTWLPYPHHHNPRNP